MHLGLGVGLLLAWLGALARGEPSQRVDVEDKDEVALDSALGRLLKAMGKFGSNAQVLATGPEEMSASIRGIAKSRTTRRGGWRSRPRP